MDILKLLYVFSWMKKLYQEIDSEVQYINFFEYENDRLNGKY